MGFTEKKKRRFGDRADGHLVQNAPALNVIMSALYLNRCDCEVSMRYEMDITLLNEFICRKNKENSDVEIKFFHCIITAIVRVLNERPLLNRFVQGGRIYQRDEYSVAFTAKRKFSDSSGESLLNYKAKKDDTIYDVSRYILGEVSEVRKEKPKKNHAEKILEPVAKLPFFVRLFLAWLCRVFDFWGILPGFMMKGDPAFSSVLVANLGSIGCPSVNHHLNNYGSTSIMITIGTYVKKRELGADGAVVERDIVDITITCDERIADGFYFSKSIKLLEKILQQPEILEKPFCEESCISEKD